VNEKGIIVMWRKYLKMLASVLVMALVFTMFVPVPEAEAAGYLTQPAIYSNKIVVDINQNFYPNLNRYTIKQVNVDVRVNNGNYKRVITGTTYPEEIPTQVEITSVSPINVYDIKVSFDSIRNNDGGSYSNNATLYSAAMAPAKVSGLYQRNWYCYICSLDTAWTKQQSVTGYQYELYNYKGALIKSGNSKSYSAYANFSNLALQTYRMRVRAYTTFNGRTSYGAWSDMLEIVPPVKKLTGKSKKKKITLKWSKVPGATSYTIFVSRNRDSGYVATKTVSAKKNKVTINKMGKKKLKSKKWYYVYVRPNRKVNGNNVFSTFANASTPIVYGKVR